MKKVYAVLNLIVLLAVVYWNYYSNTGGINGHTVADLSDEYANLFTPAGYAFAIWGVIYLGLMILVGAQVKWAFFGGDDAGSILQIGPWLMVANVGNAIWIWLWLTELTGASVAAMGVILLSLIMIIRRTNMERWDAAFPVIALVWWPICLYSGWIAVAAIANVAAWLQKIGWSVLFNEVQWTVIMISVAGVLNLLMIRYRNMREFASVGVWALVAIAVRHWGELPLVQWTSIIWAIILLTAIGLHAYKNREFLPFRDRHHKGQASNT